MRYRKLGARGPFVSEIGFGTLGLSVSGRPSEVQAIRAIRAAIDLGITFIDTADVYCLDDGEIGHNERLISRALKHRRQDVIVATKGGLRRPGGAWAHDARPEHLLAACAASLRALGTDQIDLYQLHAPDLAIPFEESVGTLSELRATGAIRMIGLSNVTASEVEEAVRIVPIASVQNRYNFFDRSSEREGVLAACQRHGVAFIAHSPFGGAVGSSRLGSVETLQAKAAASGMTVHRLALAWMLARHPSLIAIPGARRIDNISDCIRASEVRLSRELQGYLDTTLGPKINQ